MVDAALARSVIDCMAWLRVILRSSTFGVGAGSAGFGFDGRVEVAFAGMGFAGVVDATASVVVALFGEVITTITTN